MRLIAAAWLALEESYPDCHPGDQDRLAPGFTAQPSVITLQSVRALHYVVSVVVHNKLLLFQSDISDELRARATVVPSSTNKEDCTIPEASSTAAGGCTERVVCSTDCLKELLGTVCREPGCNCPLTVSSRIVGCTVIFTWVCSHQHRGRWSSSKQMKPSHGYPIFLNNLLMAAAIPLTGNHYTQFSFFCQ